MLDSHLLPPEDVVREPCPGPSPVPGGQWDEVRAWWERWNEADGRWHVVAMNHGFRHELLEDDWSRRPAHLGDAPDPTPVIDLRDRRVHTETSLRELLVSAHR